MRKILTMVFILISGCGILGRSTRNTLKTETKHAESLKAANSAELLQMINSQHYQINSDSGSSAYQLQMYPKGRLNFSFDGTFSGEFDSIKVLGKTINLHKSISTQNTEATKKEVLNSSMETELEASTLDRKTERENKSDGILAITLALVVVALIVFWNKWHKKH